VSTRAVLVLAVCAFLAGCGSERDAATTTRPQPAVAASCIFAVELDGHRYLGSTVSRAPKTGAALGPAKQPACNDTPGAVDDAPDQLVDVVAIEGVRPEVAIALPGRDDVVLIREDVDSAHYPPALAKLMR
jgi:hypothetical protein